AHTARGPHPRLDAADCDALVSRLGIKDLNYWLTHERVAFGLRDTGEIISRLAAYATLTERALGAALTAGRRPVLLQEVGGFVPVVASFFAARAKGVDNWFLEPSFFRGRLFFIKNAFGAPRIAPGLPAEVSPRVRDYL